MNLLDLFRRNPKSSSLFYCVSDGTMYYSIPPQFKCKVCGEYWQCDSPRPSCRGEKSPVTVRHDGSATIEANKLNIQRPMTCMGCGGYVVGGGCKCSPEQRKTAGLTSDPNWKFKESPRDEEAKVNRAAEPDGTIPDSGGRPPVLREPEYLPRPRGEVLPVGGDQIKLKSPAPDIIPDFTITRPAGGYRPEVAARFQSFHDALSPVSVEVNLYDRTCRVESGQSRDGRRWVYIFGGENAFRLVPRDVIANAQSKRNQLEASAEIYGAAVPPVSKSEHAMQAEAMARELLSRYGEFREKRRGSGGRFA